MKIGFPSQEFDEAVAAACHGSLSDEQARALNETLRAEPGARDAYILRLELHARLASDTDLFAPAPADSGDTIPLKKVLPFEGDRRGRRRTITLALGLAAVAAFVATLFWKTQRPEPPQPVHTTSRAIAMLNGTVDARWTAPGEPARPGAPLEPGWLRLESGLAQVVFYSGARVVIEGPAEFQLVSRNEALCRRGRLVADVPPQARGFRVETPLAGVRDLGTSFGLDVKENRTELHVFAGSVELDGGRGAVEHVREGAATLIEGSAPPRRTAASRAAFASLFDLREKSVAAEALRYNQWRAGCKSINRDASLLIHFDFESLTGSGWQLRNLAHAEGTEVAPDAIVVGCQRGEGRWTDKRSLEFQSVSDRVRLNVPGEFESLTLAAWLSVKGLDRKINSLFMCDGFLPGTLHWLIRNDGVPGLTVIGRNPGDYQIVTGPPVVTLDKFGMWLHLAVVLDGKSQQVLQYLNGVCISQKMLRIAPPFRIGAAELGNWNAKGFPEDDPFMIRNFSGALDEFFLFGRALDREEIRNLYQQGKPQGETLAAQ